MLLDALMVVDYFLNVKILLVLGVEGRDQLVRIKSKKCALYKGIYFFLIKSTSKSVKDLWLIYDVTLKKVSSACVDR